MESKIYSKQKIKKYFHGWIFAIIIFVGLYFLIESRFLGILGVEREGTVKYDDCREIIEIKNDSVLKFFKDFTCDYIKTKTGKITSGNCVNIKTTSENQCLRAYIYYVEPEIKCPDDVNGYLGYDEKCYCNTGYSFNETTKKCE